ncbi:MAG: DNA-3-methyladenine glycosylase [Ignavibacteria bacterium]|jgi:DNA-3-methyladenine glycosylase
MNTTNKSIKLDKSFYKRDLLLVAKELLGKVIVKRTKSEILSGRIVEVEAYDGEIDKAAHTYIGKTKRNEVMFDEGGRLYVYLSYGVHFCANVVTGREGMGTAVLIRAVEPVDGIETMIKNRFGRNLKNQSEIYNLTSGPGKVCNAFNISSEHYGMDLTGNKIYLTNIPLRNGEKIGKSKRIGISKSTTLQWRFFIKDNPYLSRK